MWCHFVQEHCVLQQRPFVCDYEGCGKAFIRDYHLSRHILTHTGEKPFVCAANGCDQKFNTKSNLKKHFERKHENQQKQYIQSLTRHAVVHDPDKKKMKLKVKKSREKRSLASRLSGYIPPKRKQGQGLPLCQNRESPNRVEDKVLSTVAVLTLS
ncbi:hypothetical protein H8958_021632 [Nasalis larvatus]